MQSYKEIAYNILKKSGKPMHVSELTAKVRKVRHMESKTPENTINLSCQKHDKIKWVDKGTFQVIK